MTVAGVEVVLQHLGVCLIKVPVVVIEAVNGCHYTGAMPAPGAVYEKLPGSWVVNHLHKCIYLIRCGIAFVDQRDVDVAQSGCLYCRLLIRPGIISEIDDGLDPERGQSWIVLIFGPGAAIKLFIHLAKIADLNVWEIAAVSLCKRDNG